MNQQQWEDICRRCGKCCFEKRLLFDGTVQTTKVACRHLDIVSRKCRVYSKRLLVGEGCLQLTPDLVKQFDWLPDDCAYVRKTRGEE